MHHILRAVADLAARSGPSDANFVTRFNVMISG